MEPQDDEVEMLEMEACRAYCRVICYSAKAETSA